jgi:carbamoyl-phosphate synthase large subunit
VIYVLEVNPRASRTVPFVSKAIGAPLAKIAARVMAGISLAQQQFTQEIIPPYYSVKEAVFPFIKFPGVDTVLSPEMKSTGEVMGVGRTFAEAFVKAQWGASDKLAKSGKVFVSVKEKDKLAAAEVAKELLRLGFSVCATRGTAKACADAGVLVETVNKASEGRPHIVDMIKNNEIALVINTVNESQPQAITDGHAIRRSALQSRVPQYTTLNAAQAVCIGLAHGADFAVYSVQDLHAELLASR